jgi:AraC family transcriptional regulator
MHHTLAAGHFHGELLRRRDFAGFTLTESAYPPGLRIPKHAHERAYCCLVLRGAYSETFGASSRGCGPSTLVFHPPGEVHADQFHEAGGRLFRVEVEPHWLERVRPYARVLETPADFRGGFLAGLAARLYRELRAPDALTPLAAEGLVQELLAEASRQSARAGKPPAWLGRARDLLAAQFAQPLSLDQLARDVGVHPVHLARRFRLHYRCTPGEFVRRLRVEFACGELSRTDTALAEVALAAGFADQSHFTRTFRRLMGTTPAAFRAGCRAR